MFGKYMLLSVGIFTHSVRKVAYFSIFLKSEILFSWNAFDDSKTNITGLLVHTFTTHIAKSTRKESNLNHTIDEGKICKKF